MVEAGEELVAGGVVEGEPAPDARAKREKLGGAESLGQAGIAGEDDAEQLFAIEILAGQDAQLAEDGGEGLLGFVDDEHGAAAALGDVIGPSGPKGFESGPPVVRRRGDAEEVYAYVIGFYGKRTGCQTATSAPTITPGQTMRARSSWARRTADVPPGRSVRRTRSFRRNACIRSVVDIAAYWRAQKMFSALTPTTAGANKTWTWTLSPHFPPGRFLRIGADGGTLTRGGNPLPWDAHGYYEVALDAGTLTLSP